MASADMNGGCADLRLLWAHVAGPPTLATPIITVTFPEPGQIVLLPSVTWIVSAGRRPEAREH
jgi:hypothetical protein